jgi:hypothetical protein
MPHVSHPCRHVDARGDLWCAQLAGSADGPCKALEQPKDVVRDEPRPQGEHVAIAMTMLLRAEEAQGLHEMADLRFGKSISVRCRACGHVAELSAAALREKLPRDAFIKHLGPQFRCRLCGYKGAELDARRALGHYG